MKAFTTVGRGCMPVLIEFTVDENDQIDIDTIESPDGHDVSGYISDTEHNDLEDVCVQALKKERANCEYDRAEHRSYEVAA